MATAIIACYDNTVKMVLDRLILSRSLVYYPWLGRNQRVVEVEDYGDKVNGHACCTEAKPRSRLVW